MTKWLRLLVCLCAMSSVLVDPAMGQLQKPHKQEKAWTADIFVTVGVGENRDAEGSQLVGEAMFATVGGLVEPNLLLTFGLDGFNMPVIQPQLGATLLKMWTSDLNVDIGVSSGPSDYTDWKPHFAVTHTAYLFSSLRLAITYAWQPWNKWARSSIVKLDLAL